ncbi:MAG: nitrate/nitrite transporter NrtS [Pseudomonadota bacterium]
MRSLRVSLLIGTLLVAINQGQHILAGDWSAGLWLRIILTYCVPYGVSTYAAVQAIRQRA